MKDFFTEHREKMLFWLDHFLQERSEMLSAVNSFGVELPGRLYEFTARGKTLRGSLVALFEGLYAGNCTKNSTIAGAAMELFQTALLIHDDIMDRDDLRRGASSIHHQYSSMAQDSGYADPLHTGVSLGICAGDAAFFLAMEALGKLKCSSETSLRISLLCSMEMTGVSVAQMQDIINGVSKTPRTTEDITRLYRYKTGRYTFSLPMMTGAILGGASEKDVKMLSDLGETLGIIFQLKDDELGLFGNPAATGKPEGSDVSEGKQTLYSIKLHEKLKNTPHESLLTLFSSGGVTSTDLAAVRKAVHNEGIQEEINSLIETLKNKINEQILLIPREKGEFYSIFERFIRYNQTRTV